ncbi:member of the karyopherin-beta [Sporothrix eucalyptigena]|uniref:Member of the karyopherin-beta n=1 Tax=Sporothrix eucalyptigena TaxID=1812306 RepID=A0ABP0BFB2_9PEZI
MDNQVPLPSSIEEVESLIISLYNPHTPHTTIVAVQDVLQRLQRSPEGWRLAQTLLDRPLNSTTSDQVRFFGALTIIIKLNTESISLSDDDARELLQNLLRWLALSAIAQSAILSTQKLCQALSTFFIHFPTLWPNCVKSLLLCLRTGHNVTHRDVEHAPGISEIAAGLDWRLTRVALNFTNILVTDVGKTDMRIPKFSAVHKQLLENAPDVAELIHVGLSSTSENYVKIRRESIASLQAWILYAQRLPAGGDVLVGPLRNLVNPVIMCLQDDEIYEVAVELLIDILSNYSNFFTVEHYSSISTIFESAWGEEHLKQLLGGDFDFEPLQYGLLLLAFGDARVETLMQSSDDRSRKILGSLSALLTAKGHPVGEDLVFIPALEFWATYVETMLDTMYSSDDKYEPWVDSAQALIREVVGYCWEKIQYPPVQTFMSWDSSDRTGFTDARKDVGDLLQTVFTVAGRHLMTIFTDLLNCFIPERAWAQIEATAFCLAALSDCVSENNEYDDLLSSIFSAAFFELLALGEEKLPVRLRQTALSLIERYSEYFERQPAHLPAALNLLFEAVATPSLAQPASKSIATLCSSCRSLLINEVSAFLGQYKLLRNNPQVDSLAEERIVNAIAAIIQAIPDDSVRLEFSEILLSAIMVEMPVCLKLDANTSSLDTNSLLIAKAVTQCEQQVQEGQPAPTILEVKLQASLITLRCMLGMARGLQSIAEHTVDVDGNENGAAATNPFSTSENNAKLRSLQAEIMNMILLTQKALPNSSEIVDVICSIFKAGFSETEPGLLVFPPEMVTDMFLHQTAQTPYIGSFVNTAHSFASSLAKHPSREVMEKSLSVLVPWIFGMLQTLPEPDADTDLAQRGIEFIESVLQKSLAALLRVEPPSQLESFFMFTLKVLDGREPLPKAASCDFWTTFLNLRPDDPSLKAIVTNAMEHLGPLLAQALVFNIGGNASRSELDKLCDPLKKLVVQHVRSNGWLEQALMNPAFPTDRVTASDKTFFLKKIIG